MQVLVFFCSCENPIVPAHLACVLFFITRMQQRRRLVVVELPSLEAARETDGLNHMLSESRSVATSMNALIKVLQLRCHPRPGHIPYRDSKLTLMLRDTLQ